MTDTPNVDRLIEYIGGLRVTRILGHDAVALYRELVIMRERANENYRDTVREALAKPPTVIVSTEEIERLKREVGA